MVDRGKRVSLQYFALLREQRGVNCESRVTNAATLRDLFAELKTEYEFDFEAEDLKVAVNGEFSELNSTLKDGDEVVFIPPVAGGAAGNRSDFAFRNMAGKRLRLERSNKRPS